MNKEQKSYTIKSFEVDFKGKLRIRSLFNLFQDMADTHAEKMGVGYTFCQQNNLGWVGSAYHLKINKMPQWGDEITIETWPSGTFAAGGIRDFRVKDSSGNEIITTSSQWVLIDTLRMRPVPVAKRLPNYKLHEEHALVSDFRKIDIPEQQANEQNFPVHADDIDLNYHVNNALYPSWILDGLSEDFLKKHTPSEIQISFKRSAKRGEVICLQTYQNELETVHIMIDAEKRTEYARIRVLWSQDI